MLAETPTIAQTVAQVYLFVVGVDTHARSHVYSIIEAATGGLDRPTDR